MKTIIKYIFLSLGILILPLTIWANWDADTYTQASVDDSRYVTFGFQVIPENCNKVQLEQKISSIEGVSSCSVNLKEKFAGVIFYTDQQTESGLEVLISKITGISAKQVPVYNSEGGCPVTGFKYKLFYIRDLFRFR